MPEFAWPTDNCIISVTFTPSTTGALSADLTVVDNKLRSL